jgi:hypothetical protein
MTPLLDLRMFTLDGIVIFSSARGVAGTKKDCAIQGKIAIGKNILDTT